ncbi:MAG TPA: M1 family aminopeptidase [Vicinamibacterales bacterium]
MILAILAPLAFLLTALQQPSAQPDPITLLVQHLEAAAAEGNREQIRALGAEIDSTVDLAFALTSPPPSRIVVRERDRTAIKTGQRLLLEVFWERAGEGRLSTWSVDVVDAGGEPRIAVAKRFAHVTGLYRLALTPTKQFEVRDLTVTAPDLTLTLAEGTAFVAETPQGPTAVILMGDGRMRFSPPEPAERSQIRIFTGDEVMNTRFDAAFIRIRPEDFADRFPTEALIEQAVSDRELRRAQDIFDEYVGRTLQINLSDLSPDLWSITPPFGDFIAEIRTRDYDTLTYTRSGNDAEDVTLFDRKKRKNIAVYASAEKLATRGRYYNEDDLVDYDVLAYEIDALIVPDREIVQGNVRLKLQIKSTGTATVNLRLAEELNVHGVYLPGYGRLLHLRVVNQNSLIVSLPDPASEGSELWLQVIYSGRMPPQDLDREAIALSQQNVSDPIMLPPEPRYIYSNRTYWYPQSIVSDYATLRLRITVPASHQVMATGMPVGEPSPPPGVASDGERRLVYAFVSEKPVRYVACVISRLREVDTQQLQIGDAPEDVVSMQVLANPRQVGRARSMGARAADIFQFYSRIVGDAPYPSFTLGFTERSVPGGHSPAYFAVVDQPQQTGLTWRNDPVNFDNYPFFFIAHEVAHQWWGQAVGWKNYHEQWLSEGFAQYFAALYAEKNLSPGVLSNVLRQMRSTAMRESSEGPIYLGYRLGHIKGDSKAYRSVLYNKSAMVLHMLRNMIGDDAFFRGVRSFYAERKYGKAGTDDLIATMEKASGRDLSAFFDTWIFGSNIPEARFSHRLDGNRLILRLEQTGTPMEFPVTVRITYRSGRTHSIIMIARERVSEHVVELLEPLRSVDANQDYGSLVNLR